MSSAFDAEFHNWAVGNGVTTGWSVSPHSTVSLQFLALMECAELQLKRLMNIKWIPQHAVSWALRYPDACLNTSRTFYLTHSEVYRTIQVNLLHYAANDFLSTSDCLHKVSTNLLTAMTQLPAVSACPLPILCQSETPNTIGVSDGRYISRTVDEQLLWLG